MTQFFFSQIQHTGEGDLVLFRDAVLTYCAALKEEQPFSFSGNSEAASLLRWMNVEFSENSDSGRSYLDPSRSSPGARVLVSGQGLPSTPLAWYRDQGYLGTTLFAALVRSSYGPDEPSFFPTQSELGFYFTDEQLLSETVRWDEEYLLECQSFFFEELTPAELVEHVYARLPREARDRGERHRESLEGVAFLIGEQTETLLPLTKFLGELLISANPWPELRRLMETVVEWSEENVRQAWDGSSSVFEGLPVEPHRVLLACGPALLKQRAER